ncbi:hypothetical protein PRVXT_001943 [Proteinivorax tanatarense]|uniref:Uncharacterized protein n=1 Tax=Proteinivorax tanatarense TaxID=1260629 RepID=A0AAU7VIT7_9FIRM
MIGGVASFIIDEDRNAMAAIAEAQGNVYDAVVSHYNSGYVGVEVEQDFRWNDFYLHGHRETGWLPVGEARITRLQLPCGTWLEM